MKQNKYNKPTTFYAIGGIVLILVILISQLTSTLHNKKQIYSISPQPDSTEINVDTLDYNLEDIGY